MYVYRGKSERESGRRKGGREKERMKRKGEEGKWSNYKGIRAKGTNTCTMYIPLRISA